MYNLNDDLLKLINEKLVKNLLILFFFEDKSKYIYYIIEALVKMLMYYQENMNFYSHINNKDNNEDETSDKDCYFTESYFKSILHKLYRVNILNKNLIEYNDLYLKKNIGFMTKLSNFNKLNSNDMLYKDLINLLSLKTDSYNVNVFEFYTKYAVDIEGEIGI
jgi:hypothetical protein